MKETFIVNTDIDENALEGTICMKLNLIKAIGDILVPQREMEFLDETVPSIGDMLIEQASQIEIIRKRLREVRRSKKLKAV